MRFDKAIELDGTWEIGVGSIADSSHINDEKEGSEINFKTFARQDVSINTFYTYNYYTKSKGLWKRFDGAVPPNPELDSSKIESVIHFLNDLNISILQPNEKSAVKYMQCIDQYRLKQRAGRTHVETEEPSKHGECCRR